MSEPTRPRSWKASAALAQAATLLRPPPDRDAAAWADANRVLPIGGAEPGPFRSSRTPYMVPVLRACVDPRYRRVVLVCGSQMGKTDGILNAIGHRLDDDPCPAIVAFPTRSAAEGQFEPRLMAMLRSTPSLWAKLAKGKRNKKTAKIIAGQTLRLAWAGSAAELASQPAGLVLADERDRMETVPAEGDPIELLEARGATFPGFVLVITSTPTIGNVVEEVHPDSGLVHWGVAEPEEIESASWRSWQEGTRSEWAWPCPSCGAYFVPRFSLLTWPEKSTPAEAARRAKLRCPYCGSLMGDERKTEMNERGRFVSPGQRVDAEGTVIGEPVDSDTASFWVSGLCSPWRSFGRTAKEFLEAARSGDRGRVQAIVNTRLGELYHVAGEAPKWETVAALREPYRFDEVPGAVRFVTCGVDVQKDRLIYVVRGFGYRMESWLLRHGEIYGETDLDPVWSDLAELLRTTWGPRHLAIRQMLVDSGFRPGDRWRRPEHVVYRFAARFPGYVRPSKGHDSLEQPVKLAKIDVTVGNRVLPRAVELVHIHTDYFKSWLHGRIAWPAGEPGAWHISQDASDEYCAQIGAEARLVSASGRVKWIRQRRENHALDCEVLAIAAAYLLGVHLLRDDATDAPPAAAHQGRRIRSPGIRPEDLR